LTIMLRLAMSGLGDFIVPWFARRFWLFMLIWLFIYILIFTNKFYMFLFTFRGHLILDSLNKDSWIINIETSDAFIIIKEILILKSIKKCLILQKISQSYGLNKLHGNPNRFKISIWMILTLLKWIELK